MIKIKITIWAFIILFLTSFQSGCCQPYLIEGIVSSGQDTHRLSFASVYSKKLNIGGNCDSSGRFKITFQNSYLSDTVVISCIGYMPKSIPVSKFRTGINVIYLDEKPIILPIFTLNPGKCYLNGNNQKRTHLYHALEYGEEIATVFKITKNIVISGVSLYLGNWSYHDAKIRLRIYKQDSVTKLPGEDILLQNTIIFPKKKFSWYTIEIGNGGVMIRDSVFFISIEQLGTSNISIDSSLLLSKEHITLGGYIDNAPINIFYRMKYPYNTNWSIYNIKMSIMLNYKYTFL